jgi:hypothetical protein
MKDRRVFYFQNGPVGSLADEVREPGQWKYEPLRSAFHYYLGQTLSRGEPAECYWGEDDARIRFVVTGVPSYGVLEVSAVHKE